MAARHQISRSAAPTLHVAPVASLHAPRPALESGGTACMSQAHEAKGLPFVIA
jgi:hypothetical protein